VKSGRLFEGLSIKRRCLFFGEISIMDSRVCWIKLKFAPRWSLCIKLIFGYFSDMVMNFERLGIWWYSI